jgi:uncharacterized delta-60 repeat protein
VIVAGYTYDVVSGSSLYDFTAARYNVNGTLDVNFTSVDFGGNLDYVQGVAVDSTGRIVVAGYTQNPSNDQLTDFVVVRYNPAGGLDTTFGSGGKKTVDFNGDYDAAGGMAIDSSNNIIVGGSARVSGSDRLALTRLTAANGSLDASFGTAGKAVDTQASSYYYYFYLALDAGGKIVVGTLSNLLRYTAAGNRELFVNTSSSVGQISGVAIQADGKILTGGYSSNGGASGQDFAVARFSATGTPDGGFGSSGVARTDFVGSRSDSASDMVVRQSDGKILVAGSTSGGTSDFALVRYNSEGTVDTSFGPGGNGKVVEIGLGSAQSLALDSNGNVVVAGNSWIVRYTASGSRDTSFGSGGLVSVSSVSDIQGVAIDSSNRVVVTGYRYNAVTGSSFFDFVAARYNANGTPDVTFASVDFSGGYDFPRSIAIDSAGPIIVAGYTQNPSNGQLTDFAVARYNTTGVLDTTFGSGGKKTVDFNGDYDAAAGMVIDSSNNVIVGGSANVSGSDRLALTRLTAANGSLDTSFGTAGKVVDTQIYSYYYYFDLALDGAGKIVVGTQSKLLRYTTTGTPELQVDTGSSVSQISGVAIQADGKIVIGGYRYNSGSTGQDFAVARFDSAGSLDGTFGPKGVARTDFVGSRSDSASDLVVRQSDGKILVAGSTSAATTDFALVRYDSDGTVDTSFGPSGNGKVVEIGLGSAQSLALDSNGNVVVAGNSWIVRYTASGSRDTSFGSGGLVSVSSVSDIQGVAIDGSNRVVVTGYRYNSVGGSSLYDFAAARYNVNGTLDVNFASVDFSGGYDFPRSIAIDSAGRIVVAGYTQNSSNSQLTDFAVARYNTAGGLDTTFGSGGKTTVDFNGDYDLGDSLAIDASSNIIVGGSARVSGSDRVALTRLNATNGNLDTSFGTSGKVVDTQIYSYYYYFDLALDGAGKIVVGTQSILLLYTAAGSRDTGFGSQGTVFAAGSLDQISGVAVQADGKILIAGYRSSGGSTGSDFAIARYFGNNRPPTAANDAVTTNENSAVVISVRSNDTDPDGDALTISSVNTAGTLGLVTINTNGTITYNANGAFESLATGQSTTDTFSYVISDGFGGTATATVTVTITGINDAPTVAATTSSVTVNEGQTASNTGTYSDVDFGDSDAITASLGTVTKTGSNIGAWSWSYATTDGPVQSQTVTITANDGHGGVTTTTFALTVDNVAPIATLNAPSSIVYGSGLTLNLANPSDPSGADVATGLHYAFAYSTTNVSPLTGATYGSTSTTASASFSSLHVETYYVFARIIDKDGGFTEYSSSVSVTPARLTVMANHQTKVYGQADPALTYSASGFQFTDATASVLTGSLSRAAGEHVAVSSYAIDQGTLAANSDYTIAFTGNTLDITPATMTVTAIHQAKVYGQSDPALSYSASGFQLSDTSSVLSGALSRAAGEHVAAYAISQGTLAANTDYTIAFSDNTLDITPATLTVAADPQTKIYGAADPALTYVATGFQFSDTAASVLTGSLTRAAGEHVAGSPYAITRGSLSASTDYSIAFTGSSLTITPASLTVTANARTKVYGQSDPALTYVATGFQFSDIAVTVLSGGLARAAGEHIAGSPYAIGQGTLAADSDYTIAFTGANFTITPATLTVAANARTKVYGQSDPTLTYVATGIQFSDTAASALTGSLTRAAGEHVTGSPYAIGQGTLAANGDYTIAFTGNTLGITPATLNVIADSNPATASQDAFTKVYGQANPTFSVRFDGLANGDTAASLTGTLSVSTSATTSSPVGTYSVSASGLSSTDYAINFTPGTLNITKATLTVRADDKSKIYGAANPSLTSTITGFVNGDSSSVVTGTPGLATAATSASDVGSYAITVNAGSLAATNYSFATQNGNLAIGQQPAHAGYTGQFYVTTTGTSASVTLSATITGASSGDITKANVTFVDRNGSALNTTPIHPSSSGSVSYSSNFALGSYTIGIVVGYCGATDGDYHDDDANENVVVQIAEFKTGMSNGGGYIVNTSSSSGQYPGDLNEKTNYGFSNKTGSPLKGDFNVVIRSGPKVYQFVSSTPTSLTFPQTVSPDTGIRSAFEASGVFQDITDAKHPNVLDSSATVQVATHDRGEPGTNASIQITVRDHTGAVLYSNGSGEQTIGGGNIQNKVGEQAAGIPAAAVSTPVALTPPLLQPIVGAAIARWQAAGIDPQRIDALRKITVQIGNLEGSDLGDATPGVITISPTAAGFGWFIDSTPNDDLEFSRGAVNHPAQGRMDLLSVVAHEMGHELGFAHDDGADVMNEALPPGVRRVPAPVLGSPAPRVLAPMVAAALSRQRDGATTAQSTWPEAIPVVRPGQPRQVRLATHASLAQQSPFHGQWVTHQGDPTHQGRLLDGTLRHDLALEKLLDQ